MKKKNTFLIYQGSTVIFCKLLEELHLDFNQVRVLRKYTICTHFKPNDIF